MRESVCLQVVVYIRLGIPMRHSETVESGPDKMLDASSLSNIKILSVLRSLNGRVR